MGCAHIYALNIGQFRPAIKQKDIMNAIETQIIHCANCGAVCPPAPPQGGASGYAITQDNRKICYSCSDNMQREELKDRSRPFFAYVSSDGKEITTWTGGKLMTVTISRPCQLTRQSFLHDRRAYRSIRARDIHGKNWAGRGSAGIAIKMRAIA
jgi:hypothetical protein